MSLLLLLAACSSGAKVGESCDTSGSTDECESGAVCSKNTSSTLLCLKTCVSQSDCTSTEDCNGVEGSSLKACRVK
ncbi:MAG: hypothetical protein KBF88_06860 [Polyangiaceae bacterium]|nr:hypothetical protein [Polyangiaceae bacterium]